MDESLDRVARTRCITKIIRSEASCINEYRWLRRLAGALFVVTAICVIHSRDWQLRAVVAVGLLFVPVVIGLRALFVLIAVAGAEEDYCGHRFAMTILATEPLDVDCVESFVRRNESELIGRVGCYARLIVLWRRENLASLALCAL